MALWFSQNEGRIKNMMNDLTSLQIKQIKSNMNILLNEIHLLNLLKMNEGLYKTGEISKEEYVESLRSFQQYAKDFQETRKEMMDSYVGDLQQLLKDL